MQREKFEAGLREPEREAFTSAFEQLQRSYREHGNTFLDKLATDAQAAQVAAFLVQSCVTHPKSDNNNNCEHDPSNPLLMLADADPFGLFDVQGAAATPTNPYFSHMKATPQQQPEEQQENDDEDGEENDDEDGEEEDDEDDEDDNGACKVVSEEEDDSNGDDGLDDVTAEVEFQAPSPCRNSLSLSRLSADTSDSQRSSLRHSKSASSGSKSSRSRNKAQRDIARIGEAFNQLGELLRQVPQLIRESEKRAAAERRAARDRKKKSSKAKSKPAK
eukprot:gene29962-36186_t